jgi:CDGSH-type Zn-finger protein
MIRAIMAEEKGTITIRPNGPYRVEGSVPLEGPEGQPYELKPAYSLCRCGQSASKPYCDATHKECGFVGTETAESGDRPHFHPTSVPAIDALPVKMGSVPLIRVVRDGPYEVLGSPTLTFSDGRLCETRSFYRLCRCGASKNKPFCDDTHLQIGFRNP